MKEKYFNICQTCLSCDRLLFPMDKIKDLLIFLNITIYNDYHKVKICWECKAIIMKFSKFRKQALKAQELLNTYHLEKTTLSSLKQTINVNTNFNYKENITDLETIKKEYFFNETIENNDNINDFDIKNESHHMKDRITERNKNITDDIISINEAIENNDEINDLKMKNKRPFIKTIIVKNEIIDDGTISINEAIENNDLKDSVIEKKDFIHDKIKIITLTEDEMMKNRDMKRNQPNFKRTPFKCDSCVLGFNCKKNFDLHNDKKHHESLGRKKCPVCLTRFQSLKEMLLHKLGHYTIYKCNWCDYESLSSMAAFIHCNNKHKDDSHGLIYCDQCDDVVSTPEELKEHMKIKHMLHCEECGQKFKGKQTLRTHKIRIHSQRKFSCEICSKTFKTQSRFESHITTHNTTMAKNLTYCATCNVQYKNIYIYRRHFINSKNHTERSYHCKECNKNFTSKMYWKTHYNFYHLKKSDFKCDTCNKIFMSDWRLKNHNQKHHGLKRTRNHNCDVCGKGFFTQRTLSGHKLTHSDERTFMCSECGDTFKQQSALYTHGKLIHRKEKNT